MKVKIGSVLSFVSENVNVLVHIVDTQINICVLLFFDVLNNGVY